MEIIGCVSTLFRKTGYGVDETYDEVGKYSDQEGFYLNMENGSALGDASLCYENNIIEYREFLTDPMASLFGYDYDDFVLCFYNVDRTQWNNLCSYLSRCIKLMKGNKSDKSTYGTKSNGTSSSKQSSAAVTASNTT